MIWSTRLKWFIMLWDTISFMRWIICLEQSIEEAVEFASANETDITHLNRWVLSWVRLP